MSMEVRGLSKDAPFWDQFQKGGTENMFNQPLFVVEGLKFLKFSFLSTTFGEVYHGQICISQKWRILML
jgi:hypothetical protein